MFTFWDQTFSSCCWLLVVCCWCSCWSRTSVCLLYCFQAPLALESAAAYGSVSPRPVVFFQPTVDGWNGGSKAPDPRIQVAWYMSPNEWLILTQKHTGIKWYHFFAIPETNSKTPLKISHPKWEISSNFSHWFIRGRLLLLDGYLIRNVKLILP